MPAASWATTLTELFPADNELVAVQLAVPKAVPVAEFVVFCQVTEVTPTLSVDVPVKVIDELDA